MTDEVERLRAALQMCETFFDRWDLSSPCTATCLIEANEAHDTARKALEEK